MNHRSPARSSFPVIAAASVASLLLCSVHAVAEDARPEGRAVPAMALAAASGPLSAEVDSVAPAAPGGSAAPSDDLANKPSPDAADPAAGAEAAPTASARVTEPPPPLFNKEPFPEERSRLPTNAEWASAGAVTLDPRHAAVSCKSQRVREWLRIHCKGPFFGAVRVLGGKKEGMQVRFTNVDAEFSGMPEGVDVVLPIRRGDQREIELMEMEIGYHGSQSLLTWAVISELWPEGDDSPAIAFH